MTMTHRDKQTQELCTLQERKVEVKDKDPILVPFVQYARGHTRDLDPSEIEGRFEELPKEKAPEPVSEEINEQSPA